MNNRIFKLAVIIGLISCLAITGCNSKDDYVTERALYKINKLAKKVAQNPKATPPAQVEKVIGLYKKFIKKYEGSDLTLNAHIAIAGIYASKEDYNEARKYYEYMQGLYKDKPAVLAEIAFFVGNTYELEKNWNRAVVEYKKIMQSYPFTKKSMEMPWYIIGHYKKIKDDKGASDSYEMALGHFRKLREEHPNAMNALFAGNFVIRILSEQARWQDVIGAIDKLNAEKFKKFVKGDELLFAKATIYRDKLNDNVNARVYFEELISKYPESKGIKEAKEALSKLSQQEEANTKAETQIGIEANVE